MSEIKITDADRAAALEARLTEVAAQRNQALDSAAASLASAKILGRRCNELEKLPARCEELEKQLSDEKARTADLEAQLAARPPAAQG